MRTDVRVLDDLSGLTRNELKRLRDRLISEATRQGGIDDRLKRVVMALRKAKRPEKENRYRKRRRKQQDFKVSLGSVAGDQLKKMRQK